MNAPRQSPGASAALDVVGDRVLVGVQAVDISRLSTHPVPITTQGLVTVAGQGPKDSNGAGKSSFIAALSLLHADEQWKLASGAAGAAELLFTAELAAQESRWSSVDRGYLIGVFAPPDATTISELSNECVTVWLRLNRKAPYIDLRWHDGLYVPYGSTETERAARVDDMWKSLPRSNGRGDFHANQLSKVLFGQNARCVSFLSTSVRSSPTANLLAQPLNDLPPHRIFDAIATLTGLDRELDHERALRSTEHTHRTTVLDAENELSEWEREMAVTEAGIARRVKARELLDSAQETWRARCARHLLDGVEEAGHLKARLNTMDESIAELRDEIAAVDDKLATLGDDDGAVRRFDAARKQRQELLARDRELDAGHQASTQNLERLSARLRELTDQARTSDGRDLETACAEEAAARAKLEEAIAAHGVAKAAEAEAEHRISAAESGDDVATDQLERLREAGVRADALVDIVTVDDNDRDTWEPRLTPYADAVVVSRDDVSRACEALAGVPGSMLIEAVPDGDGFDLTTFLDAVGARSGDMPVVDSSAGVVVVGGFAEPITGRAVRVAAAGEEHRVRAASVATAKAATDSARTALDSAQARTRAAQAGEQAGALQQEIAELRAANDERQEARDALAPKLAEAEETYAHELGVRDSHDERIAGFRTTRKRLEQTLAEREAEVFSVTEQRDALALLDREKSWGDSPEAAERHLADLGERESRTTAEWNDEACALTNDVAIRCFPPSTPPAEMTAELRELLVAQNWHHGSLDTRVGLVQPLQRALRAHLDDTAEHDQHQLRQITEQRTRRSNDLAAARLGLAEAEQTARAHRTSLAAGIKAMLAKVAAEFDRIDQEYGGYGAGLDFPEPEPPSEPDKPWRWTVSPKWRRAEGQRMSAYTLRSNTAQMDEKAVKLVCAAALARGGDRPLLLILDELGRNLGKQHRREAVALFERIGNDHNITVVGALQDDMERYAIESSGLYVKLRRRSDTMAYNEEPVIVGDEANRARVELLRDWLVSYRPDGIEV